MEESKLIGVPMGLVYVTSCSIGEGILAFPWVYQQAGIVLALIGQVMVMTIIYFISVQFLSVLSRCEVIATIRDKEKENYDGEVTDLVVSSEDIPTPKITRRRFDYMMVVRLTLGETAYVIACVTLTFYCILLCSSYVMVFSSSFAATVPIAGMGTCNVYEDSSDTCTGLYLIWGIIFLFFMTALTLYGYREQAWFQFVMFFIRISFLIGFYLASIHLIAIGKEIDSDEDVGEVVSKTFDPRFIGTLFAFLFLASGFQTQISEIAVIVKNRTTNLYKIFNRGIPLLFCLYTLQGVLVGLAIPDIKPISSLEFEDYTGGVDRDDMEWWAWMVRYMLTLLPAIDLMPLFPLYSIALADNILSVMLGYNQENVPRKWWFASRMAVLIPVYAIGLTVRDIHYMFTATGVCIMILMPIAIPIMSYMSRRMVPQESPYDFRYNNKYVEWAIAGFTAAMIPVVATLTYLYVE